MVIVITFSIAESDHIKRLLLYNQFSLPCEKAVAKEQKQMQILVNLIFIFQLLLKLNSSEFQVQSLIETNIKKDVMIFLQTIMKKTRKCVDVK